MRNYLASRKTAARLAVPRPPTFLLGGVVHSGDDGAIGALADELDGLVPVREVEVYPIDL